MRIMMEYSFIDTNICAKPSPLVALVSQLYRFVEKHIATVVDLVKPLKNQIRSVGQEHFRIDENRKYSGHNWRVLKASKCKLMQFMAGLEESVSSFTCTHICTSLSGPICQGKTT